MGRRKAAEDGERASEDATLQSKEQKGCNVMNVHDVVSWLLLCFVCLYCLWEYVINISLRRVYSLFSHSCKVARNRVWDSLMCDSDSTIDEV